MMEPMIPQTESLTVEFKSDRKRLPDRDLVEAVVCLANTDGGDIYLGV
jgi:ATP-dependent DNA helicase RecG